MPFSGVQDAAGFARQISTQPDKGKVMISQSGELVLAYPNRASNSNFTELEADGHPVGYPFVMPEEKTGRHVYASEANGPQSTLTQQTGEPLGLNEPEHDLEEVIKGQRPLKNKSHAAPFSAPDPPGVEMIPQDRRGFPAGVLFYSYTYVDRDNQHTLPTEEVEVEVFEGGHLRVAIPDDVPDGLRVGHYLRNQGESKRHLQRVTNDRRRTRNLLSFKYGRTAPTENETYLGRPPEMRKGRIGTGPQLRRGRGPHTLRKGRFRFVYAWAGRNGFSAACVPSDILEVTEDREKSSIRVRNIPPTRGANRFGLWVNKDDTWYRVYHGISSPSGESTFACRNIQDEAEFSIHFDGNTDSPGRDGGRESGPLYLSQEDPPSEDSSGVESPTGLPDAPEPFGDALPDPGDYWFAVSDVYGGVNGRETTISNPVKATVGPNEVPRVEFGRSMQLLPGAEFRNAERTEVPFRWESTGDVKVIDGTLILDTGGASSSNTDAISTRVPIASDETWTIQGKIESLISSGRFQIVLRQHGNDGFIDNTSVVFTEGDGYKPFSFAIGPEGDVDWLAGTLEIDFSIRCEPGNDTQVNARVELYDLALHPFNAAIRKVWHRKPGLPDDFRPARRLSYPDGSFGGVGPAPQAPTTGRTVYDRLDFEDGTVSDWALHVDDGAAGAVEPGSAMDGEQGFKANTPGGTASSYLSKSFSEAEDGLGVRLGLRPTGIADYGGSAIGIAAIRNSEGLMLASVELVASSAREREAYFRLITYNAFGRYEAKDFVYYVEHGDAIDAELILTGAHSRNGKVDLLIGFNGEERSLRASIGAIDYRGQFPVEVSAGTIYKNRSAAFFSVDYDSVAVTERGDYIGEPPALSTEPPDRPKDFAGQYMETTPLGERVNQAYLFIQPGEEPSDRLGFQDVRFPVYPGTWTLAIYGRHRVFGEEVAHPGKIFALTPEGELEIGGVYGEGGCTGYEDWADRYTVVEVPEDCFELVIKSRNMVPGEYVWQNALVSEGALHDQADRDAARNAPRETSATIKITAEAAMPEERVNFNPSLISEGGGTYHWIGVDYDADLDGASLSEVYRTSDTIDGLTEAQAADEGIHVHPRRHAEIEMTLTGDGEASPFVRAAGIIYAPRIPTLLRENRTEIPGGTAVANLENSYARPSYEVLAERRRPSPVSTSASSVQIPEAQLQVFTEKGKRIVEEELLEHPWVYEDPKTGMAWFVHFYGTVLLEREEDGVFISRGNMFSMAEGGLPKSYVESSTSIEGSF